MLLEAQSIDVQRIVFLSGTDVMEDRAGSDGRRLVPDEPIAFERAHVKLALDQRNGKVARPDPVFNARSRRNTFERRGHLGRRCQQNFACAGDQNRVDGELESASALKLRRAKFAC